MTLLGSWATNVYVPPVRTFPAWCRSRPATFSAKPAESLSESNTARPIRNGWSCLRSLPKAPIGSGGGLTGVPSRDAPTRSRGNKRPCSSDRGKGEPLGGARSRNRPPR